MEEVLDAYDTVDEIVVVTDRDSCEVVVVFQEGLTINGREIDADLLSAMGGGTIFKRVVSYGLLDDTDIQYATLVEYKATAHCVTCMVSWLDRLKQEAR